MYKVFIASSNKTKAHALKFKKQLMDSDNKIDVVGWWETNTAFQNGDSTLESLLQISKNFDFAVVFLSPDYLRENNQDIAQSIEGGDSKKGHRLKTPSDNCVFELGIFASSLGTRRCFVLCSIESGDLVKSLSDFRGINYFKVTSEELENGCRSKVNSISEAILGHPRRITYEEIPLITMEDLNEREIKTTSRSTGKLIRSATVIVNSTQPLELNTSFAQRVKQNIEQGISYKYFFPAVDNNLSIVAELFQSLAASHIASDNTTELKLEMQNTIDPTKENLNKLKDRVAIYFLKDIQPIEFCIHNASSIDNAICYLRRPDGSDNNAIKFVQWASRQSAYEIAKNLDGFGKRIRGNKFVFRSTKDIDIYSDAHQEKLEELTENILELFPQELHNLVQEVCFHPENL
jgi:hypothetical protein